MNYDQPRIWLLAAFSVAARDEIQHGVIWATKAAGFFGPVRNAEDIPAVAMRFKRPIYSSIREQRVRLCSEQRHNRIMTGLKLAVDPETLNSSTIAERACMVDMLNFVLPVLRPHEHGMAEVQRLMRALLRDKELSFAA
jgi:hypothetical protein